MCKLRGFLTNLGKYNEGDLIGEWVDLPIDEDGLKEVFNRIGINNEYEEYFWTDWECDIPEVCNTIGEYMNIDEANELAERVENVEDPAAFAAALELFRNLDETFEKADDMICIGEVILNMDRTIGEHYKELLFDGIECEFRDTLETYFDCESYGRDIRLEGSFIEVDGYVWEYVG
jgi:hypothetical protein